MARILALSIAALISVAQAQQPAPAPTATARPVDPVTARPAPPATTAAPATTTPPASPASATEKPEKPSVRISVSQCNVEGPFAAITFDDGPDAIQTPRLLKMLKDRGIRSTFFVVGRCVAANPEIARQIVSEGHEIANHSWSHSLLSKMAQESVRDELQRTHTVIKQETGITPTLMRPPYGGFTTNQRAWAHAAWGYQCILWDVDSYDWKHRTPAKTQAIILSETKPGSIILCHDIHRTTVDAMPATLDALLAKGLKLITVSDLLKMHKDKPAGSTKAPATRSLTPQEGASAATTLNDLPKTQPLKAETAKP
jgi:peptidoglycan-N-acetylglucosamine deacetylase